MKKVFGDPFLSGAVAALLLMVPLMQLMAPFPLYVASFIGGIRGGIISVATMGIVTLLFNRGEWIATISIVIVIGSLPVLSGWLFRAGWQIRHCAIMGYLLVFLLLLLGIGWLAVSENDPRDPITSWSDAKKEQIIHSLTESKGVDAVTIAGFREEWDRFTNLIAWFAPVILASGWYLMHLANLTFAKWLMWRWRAEPIAEDELNHYRVPFVMIWMLIAMAVLALIGETTLRFVGLNLVVLLVIPYFFQGLAIVNVGFRWRKVPFMWQMVFFSGFVIWGELFFPVVTALGLFDTWADFRNRFFKPKEGG